MDQELLRCAQINFENLEQSRPNVATDPYYRIAKAQLDEALGGMKTVQLLNVERLSKLDNYLQRQVSNHLITQAASAVYRVAVFEINSNLGRTLGIPDALPGEAGDMKYHWRGKASSVRLDIQPNGAAELYFLNKQTNEDFLVEYRVGSLSDKVAGMGVRTVIQQIHASED